MEFTSIQENSRLIEIHNQRILSVLYLKSEVATDTTIFFFHGAMASMDQFEHLIAHFQQYFNVVAYDAYGCGNSDKPIDPILWGNSNYTIEEHAADASKIYARYATKKNILVGHSFGTAIVSKVVTAATKDVSDDNDFCGQDNEIVGTILLGTIKSCPTARHPLFFLPVFMLDAIQSVLSTQFTELAFSPSSSAELKAASCTFSNRNQMHVAKSFYTNFSWASDEDWITISKYPVLICQGKDDLITPPSGAMELHNHLLRQSQKFGDNETTSVDSTLGSSVENPKVVMKLFADAGHQIMQEQPDLLIQTMMQFLNDNCCSPVVSSN